MKDETERQQDLRQLLAGQPAQQEAFDERADHAHGGRAQERGEPEVIALGQDRDAEIGPQHEEGAVHQVGDAHQAEDQREARPTAGTASPRGRCC